MVKGGSKKKARSQPSGEVSATSGNATLAKPPVAARKSDLTGGKKTVHVKPAAATHALAADSEKEKTRWTEADDTRMLQVFLAEKSEGNQSESRWKAGVYKHVADELNLKVSGGGLKDPASVRNRFSRLKDTYKTIAALREVSGFTWDPEHGCVGVNNNIWQKYVKAHPKAAPFRLKGWPHYDDMDTLCRAVIACGHLAFHATLESLTGAQEGGEEEDRMGRNDQEDDALEAEDEEPIPWSPSPSANRDVAPGSDDDSTGLGDIWNQSHDPHKGSIQTENHHSPFYRTKAKACLSHQWCSCNPHH
ncbi:hypothetical protein BS47DRAFT_1320981 [Hydnum rufescens UP504]|uniref:Myb/SANT-like domain-containing protein n=1 Tax=Hydnum rufescens UP504 TaxID=1448309 RepID=A0A9P6ALT5_9AGAM|nr:hypothetical protein BS47DRAFT_1320981 [Hydnum rufescens UP504]